MKPLMLQIHLSSEVQIHAPITAVEEPLYPTPQEPDIRRQPTPAEVTTLIEKLRSGNFRLTRE